MVNKLISKFYANLANLGLAEGDSLVLHCASVLRITGLLATFQTKFLVSKETVVLRRWERSKQKFGFIKRVDKGEITTVKDLES